MSEWPDLGQSIGHNALLSVPLSLRPLWRTDKEFQSPHLLLQDYCRFSQTQDRGCGSVCQNLGTQQTRCRRECRGTPTVIHWFWVSRKIPSSIPLWCIANSVTKRTLSFDTENGITITQKLIKGHYHSIRDDLVIMAGPKPLLTEFVHSS